MRLLLQNPFNLKLGQPLSRSCGLQAPVAAISWRPQQILHVVLKSTLSTVWFPVTN